MRARASSGDTPLPSRRAIRCLEGGVDDDDGVETLRPCPLDEKRDVIDGERTGGGSAQDLPGATLDGWVRDGVED